MLRCICKKYRANFRLCLFRYCFCLKQSIVLLSPCAFLSELSIAPHGAIMSISFFAHYLYRDSCLASIHRTYGSIFYHLCSYHKALYNAKRENFESFIRTIHDASLFSTQVIHHILLDRVYLITTTTIQCLCLPHIHSHSTHN